MATLLQCISTTKPTVLVWETTTMRCCLRTGMVTFGWYISLDRFDPETGEFLRLRHDPNDPTSISSNTVHHISQDKEGNLWVSADNTLHLVVFEGEERGADVSFQRFPQPEEHL